MQKTNQKSDCNLLGKTINCQSRRRQSTSSRRFFIFCFFGVRVTEKAGEQEKEESEKKRESEGKWSSRLADVSSSTPSNQQPARMQLPIDALLAICQQMETETVCGGLFKLPERGRNLRRHHQLVSYLHINWIHHAPDELLELVGLLVDRAQWLCDMPGQGSGWPC